MSLEQSIYKYKTSLGRAFFASALLAVPAVYAQSAEFAPSSIIEHSADHGPASPQRQTSVTVHLNLHNQAAYDKAIQDLYTPGSPTFHKWFTASDFARYAPTSEEQLTVRKELEAQGLTVVSTDEHGFSIRARGPISSIERAFNTQIHEFEREHKTFTANVTPARLSGVAAPLVQSISGLSTFGMKPYAKLQVNPRTGKPAASIPIAQAATGLGKYFTNKCFKAPATVSLSTSGASLPVGSYFGNLYDQGTLQCGWTPAQIRDHYRLNLAYSAGVEGAGQTIVIVDGPSDPTVAADLKEFSKVTGLSAIDSTNFQIIYPDGKPTAFELNFITNWDVEADLDIQWAHVAAPKAKIILLITPTQDWTEFEYAIQYAVNHKLGNVISNSYGYPEAAWGKFTLQGFEAVLKTAAASGVAVNFSSGDGGDDGTGSPSGGGASYPATSAFATAIGGTSLDIPTDSGPPTEVGWGNNGTYISFGTTSVLDPPLNLGFLGGSGGGESSFVTKPAWQSSIPGKGRQIPDISAVADPYTGAIIDVGGFLEVVGGTSLASPLFSGIWTLADEKAGKPLGQVAPLLATLPAGSVSDIVPVTSATNPAGIIFDSAGATYYSSDSLMAPLGTTKKYFAAIWDLGGGQDVDLSFGTDSSLTVTKGWDNVTGWGKPNGYSFIKNAAAAGTPAAVKK